VSTEGQSASETKAARPQGQAASASPQRQSASETKAARPRDSSPRRRQGCARRHAASETTTASRARQATAKAPIVTPVGLASGAITREPGAPGTQERPTMNSILLCWRMDLP
jgi:hypothetical protein